MRETLKKNPGRPWLFFLFCFLLFALPTACESGMTMIGNVDGDDAADGDVEFSLDGDLDAPSDGDADAAFETDEEIASDGDGDPAEFENEADDDTLDGDPDSTDGDAETESEREAESMEGDGDTDPESLFPPDPGEMGPHTVSTAPLYNLHVPGGLTGYTIPLTIFLPDGDGPFPVVLFTHGFQLGPGNYTSYGLHLGSWGYIVVMPQMPSPLPNNHRELKEFLVAILDWMETDNADPASALQRKANLTKIGLSGHSMGGKISLLTASEDSRATASFTLDPVDAAGIPFANPTDYPSVTPERMSSIAIPLGFFGETVNGAGSFGVPACAPLEDNFQQYYQHAVGPTIEIEAVGANHMSFLDDPNCGVACLACPAGTDTPSVTLRLARKYMTAFYNVHLKGESGYRAYLAGPPMEVDVGAGRVLTQWKNGF